MAEKEDKYKVVKRSQKYIDKSGWLDKIDTDYL